ncbi:MAG: hypothetical protein U0K95_01975 [Eubacterium sp.]|nr:hypothetical protein [Eubacterium sp.]
MVKYFENDRIAKYFKKYLGRFLFVEFSEEFMEKLKITDIAKGVRVPINPEDLKDFSGGEGVSATKIAENMIWVIGCDPNFKFAEDYKVFMKRFFNSNLAYDVAAMGVKAVNNKDMEAACIHFRAAMQLDPSFVDAIYNYARVCREMYMESDDDEYIGWFKAESIEIFEQITIDFPEYEQAYYFLGYAYLNLGLYAKAGITWEKFMTLAKDPQVIQEIAQRLRQIAEPRKIEEGCNAVVSGRYQEGLGILMGFAGSDYDTWWPLHFYLGTAYEELGNDTMAEMEYKRTLQLNAANIDCMDGLIRIYDRKGDEINKEKYTTKKELVLSNLKADYEDNLKNN